MLDEYKFIHPLFWRNSNIHMWQSRVESNIIPLRILIALPCSKCSSAELPLRVGLICTV